MDAMEFKKQLTEGIEELDGQTMTDIYGSRVFDVRADLIDGIDEGCVDLSKDAISEFDFQTNSFKVTFEDKIATVRFCKVTKKLECLLNDRYPHIGYVPRRASVYERTRALVYATGNKWAIENFEATH